jgi:hypothetical protein
MNDDFFDVILNDDKLDQSGSALSDIEKKLKILNESTLERCAKEKENIIKQISILNKEKVRLSKRISFNRDMISENQKKHEQFSQYPQSIDDPALLKLYRRKVIAEKRLKNKFYSLLFQGGLKNDIEQYDQSLGKIISSNHSLKDTNQTLYSASVDISEQTRNELKLFVLRSFNTYLPLRQLRQSDDFISIISKDVLREKIQIKGEQGQDPLTQEEKREYLNLVLAAFKYGHSDKSASPESPDDIVKSNNERRMELRKKAGIDSFDHALFAGVKISKSHDIKRFLSTNLNEIIYADMKDTLNAVRDGCKNSDLLHLIDWHLEKSDLGLKYIFDRAQELKEKNQSLTEDQRTLLLHTHNDLCQPDRLAHAYTNHSQTYYSTYQHGLDAWPSIKKHLRNSDIFDPESIDKFEKKYMKACEVWSKPTRGFDGGFLEQIKHSINPINTCSFLIAHIAKHGKDTQYNSHDILHCTTIVQHLLFSMTPDSYQTLLKNTPTELHDNLAILIDPNSPYHLIKDDNKLASIANIISGGTDAIFVNRIAQGIKDSGNPYVPTLLYQNQVSSLELQDQFLQQASTITQHLITISPACENKNTLTALRTVCLNADNFTALCNAGLKVLGYDDFNADNLKDLSIPKRVQLAHSMLNAIGTLHDDQTDKPEMKSIISIIQNSNGTSSSVNLSENLDTESKFVIFGERHNDKEHTKTETKAMIYLKSQGFKYVGLELPYDIQHHIDAYFTGQISLDDFLQKSKIGYQPDFIKDELVEKINVAKENGYSPICFDLSTGELNMIRHFSDSTDPVSEKIILENRNEHWKKVMSLYRQADPDAKIAMFVGHEHIACFGSIQEKLLASDIETEIIDLTVENTLDLPASLKRQSPAKKRKIKI